MATGRTYPLHIAVRMSMETGRAQRGMRRMAGLYRQSTRWTQRLRAGMLGMNTMLMTSGATFVAAGLAARGAISTYYRYSNSMGELRAILASTNTDMRAHRQLMEVVSLAARDYGFSLEQASAGMNTLANTGVSAHEMMRYFPIAAQFARGAELDMERATTVLVDAMRQFNMQSEQGARTLAASFTIAGRMASTSIQDLQQSFRYAAVEMSAMGYQSDEVISALAGMSAIGLRSTTAGTRLRRMMVQLIRPTRTTTRHFRELGITQEQLRQIMWTSDGQLRGFADSTVRLSNIFNQLGTSEERITSLVQMMGVRGLAAGAVFSRIHARGADWLRIQERLRRGELPAVMQNVAQERMRNFAAQLNKAKTGLQEVGVAFMEMLVAPLESADRGFGDLIGDLSLVIRYGGDANRTTGAMAERLRDMDDETVQMGLDIRDTLHGLANFVRLLGRVGGRAAQIAGRFPTATLAVIAFGGALKPVIGYLLTYAGASSVATAAAGTSGAATAGAGTTLVAFGGTCLAVAASALALGEVLSVIGMRLFAGEDYMNSFNHEIDLSSQFLDDLGLGFINQIPIANRFFQFVITGARLTRDAIRTLFGLEGAPVTAGRRRAREGGQYWEASERQLVLRRARQLSGQQRLAGASRTQIQTEAAGREMNVILTRMAEMIRGTAQERGMGISPSEELRQVREHLQGAGLSGAELSSALERYQQIAPGVTQVTGTTVDRLEDMGYTLERASERVVRFSSVLRGIQGGQLLGEHLGAEGGVMQGPTLRMVPAQDAIVQSTGWLPVSGGDMIVDRTSLANAMTYGRGELVNAAQQMVGTMPQSQVPSQGQSLQLELEIPVQINEREIARAAGRYNLQIDQRRGSNISPGSRRRVASSGVR